MSISRFPFRISLIFCVKQVFILCVLLKCYVNAFNITILHTNDFHGRLEEADQYGFTCDETERREKQCFGGVARLATAVKTIRAAEKNVVLLDGGDRFAGTIWSEVYKGNATLILVNDLNYTAVTLGNHDFDYGLQNLIHFIEKAKCPVVISNMNTSKEPTWPNQKELVVTSKVIDVDGEKVGVVGYIITSTPRSSNSGANIQFLPIIESVQKAVTELESKGITKIIALGHAGLNIDKAVAKKVKGVDIVVGGHSHTFLFDGDPPSVDKPQGPYPITIHPNHNRSLCVPVVQAFWFGKYLGHLRVTFNNKGEVTNWHGSPILLDHKIAKDPRVDDVVKHMKVLVDRKGEVVIGQSKVKLDASNDICSTEQCNIGQVFTAAMVYHYKAHNASIAFLNGGSIKSSLPVDSQGNIFYKDLFNSLPYWNTVDLVELSGADIMESLKVSYYLQIKGLQVKYSNLKPTSRKVEQIKVKLFPCTSNDCYEPLDSSKIYKVVINSYLVNGGNTVITKNARNRLRGVSLYDVIVEYFRNNSPVTTEVKTGTNASMQMKQNLLLILMMLLFIPAMFAKNSVC